MKFPVQLPQKKEPWNKGRLIGQKPPFNLKEIWAVQVRLQMSKNHRELAMFNLAIDSKLRCCDLVKLRVSDVFNGGYKAHGAMDHAVYSPRNLIEKHSEKLVLIEGTGQPTNSIIVNPTYNETAHPIFRLL